MKKLYTSPMVTVEELTKADVLCSSTEQNLISSSNAPGQNADPLDNINQTASTLVKMTSFL